MVLLAVCFFNFLSYNLKRGWPNFNWFEQNERYEISSEKGHLYIERERKNELVQLAPYLKNRHKVMVSHENLWGHVLLLNAHPIYLPFRFKEKSFYYFLQQHEIPLTSITYLELKRKPFPESFIQQLHEQSVGQTALEVQEIGDFRLYSFSHVR